MSKLKKKGDQDAPLQKVILATAILNLINALINLISRINE